MSAGYDPASPGLVVEDPSTPVPAVPERLRVALGPLRFSGLVVGPDHPYVLDCWTAIVGPTPVLLLVRLHQLVGLDVDTRALAASVALGGTDWAARLASCLGKLARYRLLCHADHLVELGPALPILTGSELSFAGELVTGLHGVHLASARTPRNRLDRQPLQSPRQEPRI